MRNLKSHPCMIGLSAFIIIALLLIIPLSVSAVETRTTIMSFSEMPDWDIGVAGVVDGDSFMDNGRYNTGPLAGSIVHLQASIPTMDLSALLDDDCYIEFDLFVSEVEKIGRPNNYDIDCINFEMSSAGGPDNAGFRWYIEAPALQDGWNRIRLTVFSAEQNKILPDFDAFNYLRFYFYPNEAFDGFDGLYIKLGDIDLVQYDSAEADLKNEFTAGWAEPLGASSRPGSRSVIKSFSTMPDWDIGMSGVEDGEAFMDNDGGYNTGPVVGGIVHLQSSIPTMDLSALLDDDCYIEFDLFVSEVEKIGRPNNYDIDCINFEMSSTGGPDNAGFRWYIEAPSLQDGWNIIRLTVYSAEQNKILPDFDAFNYLRFYFYPNEAFDGFDGLYLKLRDIEFVKYDSPPASLKNEFTAGWAGTEADLVEEPVAEEPPAVTPPEPTPSESAVPSESPSPSPSASVSPSPSTSPSSAPEPSAPPVSQDTDAPVKTDSDSSSNLWWVIIIVVVAVAVIAVVVVLIVRKRKAKE